MYFLARSVILGSESKYLLILPLLFFYVLLTGSDTIQYSLKNDSNQEKVRSTKRINTMGQHPKRVPNRLISRKNTKVVHQENQLVGEYTADNEFFPTKKAKSIANAIKFNTVKNISPPVKPWYKETISQIKQFKRDTDRYIGGLPVFNYFDKTSISIDGLELQSKSTRFQSVTTVHLDSSDRSFFIGVSVPLGP